MAVAEKYVAAFGELAKQGTTVLLPSNTGWWFVFVYPKSALFMLIPGDMGSMVAQAMAVYSKMNSLPTVPEERELEELSHRSEVNINLD